MMTLKKNSKIYCYSALWKLCLLPFAYCLLLIASCKVGKEYQRPTLELPKQFDNTSFSDTSSIADIEWKNFVFNQIFKLFPLKLWQNDGFLFKFLSLLFKINLEMIKTLEYNKENSLWFILQNISYLNLVLLDLHEINVEIKVFVLNFFGNLKLSV